MATEYQQLQNTLNWRPEGLKEQTFGDFQIGIRAKNFFFSTDLLDLHKMEFKNGLQSLKIHYSPLSFTFEDSKSIPVQLNIKKDTFTLSFSSPGDTVQAFITPKMTNVILNKSVANLNNQTKISFDDSFSFRFHNYTKNYLYGFDILKDKVSLTGAYNTKYFGVLVNYTQGEKIIESPTFIRLLSRYWRISETATINWFREKDQYLLDYAMELSFSKAVFGFGYKTNMANLIQAESDQEDTVYAAVLRTKFPKYPNVTIWSNVKRFSSEIAGSYKGIDWKVFASMEGRSTAKVGLSVVVDYQEG